MASGKEYLHFILEQLSDLDDISYRPMMGEFILYYRGKIVGGIYLPVPQHTGVIGQNRKAQPLVFSELLCFCLDTLCVERRCAGRLVWCKLKVRCQLLCCIIQ